MSSRKVLIFLVISLMAPMVGLAAPAGASTHHFCQANRVEVFAGFFSGSSSGTGPKVGNVTVHNLGPRCAITGNPGVSGWDGHQVGRAAQWVHPSGKPVIWLNPGDWADAALWNIGTGHFGGQHCDPEMVHRLRVFLPNSGPDGDPHFTRWDYQACRNRHLAQLWVGVFQHYNVY